MLLLEFVITLQVHVLPELIAALMEYAHASQAMKVQTVVAARKALVRQKMAHVKVQCYCYTYM